MLQCVLSSGLGMLTLISTHSGQDWRRLCPQILSQTLTPALGATACMSTCEDVPSSHQELAPSNTGHPGSTWEQAGSLLLGVDRGRHGELSPWEGAAPAIHSSCACCWIFRVSQVFFIGNLELNPMWCWGWDWQAADYQSQPWLQCSDRTRTNNQLIGGPSCNKVTGTLVP